MYAFPPRPDPPFSHAKEPAHPTEVGYAYRRSNSRIRIPIYGPHLLHIPPGDMAILHYHLEHQGGANSAVVLLRRDTVNHPTLQYLTTPRPADPHHLPILRAALPFARTHRLATWDADVCRTNLNSCTDQEVASALRRHPLFCIRSGLEALGIDADTPFQACLSLEMTPAAFTDHLATTLMLAQLLDRIYAHSPRAEDLRHAIPLASPQPAPSPRKARKTATRKEGG